MSSELRFYPGPHQLVWVVDGKAQIRAEAWGGDPNIPANGMTPKQTTAGRYVIYSYAPYRTKSWANSRIRWGTRLKLDTSGQHVLYATGSMKDPWKKVEDKVPDGTVDNIRAWYQNLYGPQGRYDTNHDGIPESWVFNDFGPWAVRYFRDTNHNKKLDKGESLSGEMFHTTPNNEASTDRDDPVILGGSHGCIHVKPLDRDKLHQAGAFNRGTDLIIYSYEDVVPDDLK